MDMVKLSVLWFLSCVVFATTHVARQRSRNAGNPGRSVNPIFTKAQQFQAQRSSESRRFPINPEFEDKHLFEPPDSIDISENLKDSTFMEKDPFPSLDNFENPEDSLSSLSDEKDLFPPLEDNFEIPEDPLSSTSMEKDLFSPTNNFKNGNSPTGLAKYPSKSLNGKFAVKQHFQPSDIRVLKQKAAAPVVGPPKKCRLGSKYYYQNGAGKVKLNITNKTSMICGISNNPNERIVGGEIASPNEFPWQVGFRVTPDESTGGKPGAVFCGGTLINDRFVLTAGHCLDKRRTKDIELLLGEHDYEKAEGSNAFIVKLKRLILHPRYQSDGYHNDIALAELENTVPFTPIASPPCFPRPGIEYTGKIAVVSGWGRVGEDEALSNILRKLEVPVISLTECRKLFEGDFFLYDGVLCAYHKEGGRDACSGDSGGPLVWKNKGRWYLIGVVSWGEGCAREGVPAAYTRVDKYYRWIRSKTEGAVGCTD